MARIDFSDGWTASGTVSSLQAALNSFFRAWSMRVVGEQAGEVHARQGWWLVRVFGGRLSPPGWLPKRAVVKLRPDGSRVAVRASIEESSPTAALSHRLMDKYRDYFTRWMEALKTVLR
jgi:hypothetical protein